MPKLKTAPKVMDVVHPNNRQPSPTSRPVVTSRPYITADPMLNIPKEDAIVSSTERVAPTSAPDIDKAAIKAARAKLKPTRSLVMPTDDAEPDESEAVAIEQSASDVPSATQEQAEELPSPAVSEPGPPEDTKLEDVSPDEPERQPAEAQSAASSDATIAQNREEELERLIAKGTYAVPINKVKRRRARTVLVLLVVLLLALVTIDLLADIKIITLPFGLPHTNFLAS